MRGNNRNKQIPKRKCGDVRRKPHQRQETPVSPINTNTTTQSSPKKTATLRLHPKLKSPNPKTPPSHIPHQSRFPSLPSAHHPPKQRPPSSPPPLNTRRGACFTSRHQPQTPTNQPQPSSCRPYLCALHSPDDSAHLAAGRIQNAIQAVGSCARRANGPTK